MSADVRPARRWLLRSVAALSLLVIVAALIVGWWVWRMQPVVSGTLVAPGLAATVIIGRDDADVPHIQAESSRDAWFALGYLHAQERGWQLEFNRRLMHGRLSEVLGPATLELDTLIRTLGIIPAARRQIQSMPPDVLAALQAYSSGINSFRTHGRQGDPPEFTLLGIEPGGWDPVDSVGWTLMMALDLGGNWGTEFARLTAAAVLDATELWQLFPPYEGEPPATTVDLPALYRDLGVYRASPPAAAAQAGPADMAWPDLLLAGLGEPGGRGSNNWAVPGSRTESGLPLLANDPHLELSAPAIWYVASLKAPGLKVAGATIPGLPFVVLGKTREVAWTFTNTGPDVQDLYLEALHPDDPQRYRTPTGWATFMARHEVIRVKGQPDVEITVRHSRHGPILSDAQASHAQVLDTRRYVVALRWSALDADNHTMVAGIRMNQAATLEELIAAGAHHHSPMQSVVLADTTGRIAFKVMGRAPLRRGDNDLQGVAPAPGWDVRYDWAGWIPYAENPGQFNPDAVIVTANQRIHGPEYPHFLGQEWHPPYRYQRILDLLEAAPRHSPDTMARIQGDVLSLAMLRLLPQAQAAAERVAQDQPASAPASRVPELLRHFDGQMAADRPEPLILVAWADHLTRRLIEPRVGTARFQAWYGGRHFRQTLEMILEQDLAWWCAPTTCAEQSAQAMADALASLAGQQGHDPTRWRWGAAHPALSVHRPFGDVSLLGSVFNVSVPSGGDHFTINVGQYRAKGDLPYANRQAASLRLIFDLANLDQTRFIYQTGQGGVVTSPRYRDMRDAWATLHYRRLDTRPAEFRHLLYLTP